MFSTLIAAIFLPLLSLSAQALVSLDTTGVLDFFILIFLTFFFLRCTYSRSWSVRLKNRKDAQEIAAAASLHSLISRAKEDPLHGKPATKNGNPIGEAITSQIQFSSIYLAVYMLIAPGENVRWKFLIPIVLQK